MVWEVATTSIQLL